MKALSHTFLQEGFENYLCEEGHSAQEAQTEIMEFLQYDGDPYYDLGSYTTVEMEPEANELILHTIKKNLINKNEYLATTVIHNNLVKTISKLLHAPDINKTFGTSTVGSSEAAFLSLLAAKHHWEYNGMEGTPNVVLCANAHLCWFKSAKYLGITIQKIEIDHPNEYPLPQIINAVNAHTICVVAVLGCTSLGSCDPIHLLQDELLQLNQKNNWDVGIHVDAAIGGFVYPFLDHQKPKWDFKLSLVRSINVSGHKYGLVYPGLGWLIFRNIDYFHETLNPVYDYLNGTPQCPTLNFSRNSCFVVSQSFNFLHYGIAGYKSIIHSCLEKSRFLSAKLAESGYFIVLSTSDIPLVVFALKDRNDAFVVEKFCTRLRQKNWMLPHYKLPVKNPCQAMRIVIRNDMTIDRLNMLVMDILNTYKELF